MTFAPCDFNGLTEQQREAAVAGKDMCRVSLSTKGPLPPRHEDQLRALQFGRVRQWLARLGQNGRHINIAEWPTTNVDQSKLDQQYQSIFTRVAQNRRVRADIWHQYATDDGSPHQSCDQRSQPNNSIYPT